MRKILKDQGKRSHNERWGSKNDRVWAPTVNREAGPRQEKRCSCEVLSWPGQARPELKFSVPTSLCKATQFQMEHSEEASLGNLAFTGQFESHCQGRSVLVEETCLLLTHKIERGTISTSFEETELRSV